MGNSRFRIFGFSQQEIIFEGSWVQWEKKNSQDSFQWEITGLQYWAYFNGGLNLREVGFNRKRRVATMGNCWTQWDKRVAMTHFNGKVKERLDEMGKKGQPGTHFNRKFHIYNIWPTSMGEI